MKEAHIEWPRLFLVDLKPEHEQKETLRSAEKDQKMLSGIEVQTAVINAGGEFWASVRKWGAGQISPDADRRWGSSRRVTGAQTNTEREAKSGRH